jgi:beta-phosphoglucomutase-like phosphatase (HAD superfamily)
MRRKEALFRKMAADPTLMFPTPGLIDLLKSANSASIRVHAVTNAPYENAVFMMEALDLNKYFEGVVIGERCARPKPFPDPYLAGLSCVGLYRALPVQQKLPRYSRIIITTRFFFLDAQPQNTIVFEDSPTGIRAAVAAGIKVVAIATHQSHDVLKNAGASYIVKDFTGLTLPILEGYLQ